MIRVCTRLLRLLLALLTTVPCAILPVAAHALDPAKTFSQYVHTSWGAAEGFVGGTVYAICQSADGYLWIGTERGLVRFDGFQFTLLQRPVPNQPPIGAVRGLVLDAEGALWIRLDGPHLLVYRNGYFEDAVARYGLEEVAFTAMSLDTSGHLLLWGLRSQTLRFQHGRFARFAPAANVPGIALALAATEDGQLWAGTRDSGLFRISGNHLSGMSPALARTSINAVVAAGDSGVWLGTNTGLYRQTAAGVGRPLGVSPLGSRQVFALCPDRAGTLWVGTAHKLFRVTSNAIASLDVQDEVTALYEDRDGDLWYGGSEGVHRLRDGTFTKYTRIEGLPTDAPGPVYVDGKGVTWFAPLGGGLYWLDGGKSGRVDAGGLAHDVVLSISGEADGLLLGREHGGVTQLSAAGAGHWKARTWTEQDGLAQNSVYAVHRNRDGTVWVGTGGRGLSRVKDGTFTNYPAGANGPGANTIFSIAEGRDGTMWFATPSGLSSFAQGRWKTLSAADGLPSSNIRSVFEDSHQTLWIATAAGLAAFEGGRIRTWNAPDLLREEILGVTEGRRGELWIVTSDHVLEVDRNALLTGNLREADLRSYGPRDGLPGEQGVRRDHSILTDARGRVWIALAGGLASTGAAETHTAAVAARIEPVEAGGSASSKDGVLRFPAGTRNVAFHFGSTNLSEPERVVYRYRLDGAGKGWSDAQESRQVVFTNVAPGSYRFRVVALLAGAPNGPEAAIPFSIAPAMWQTAWFRVLCAMGCCLLLLATYRWRLNMWTRRLDQRFQDRLEERTRIARDLHDTLLQGVLSASLQLDLIEEKTPLEAATKPALRRVLELMRQVTEEGRGTLRGLRNSSGELSVEAALGRLGPELAANGQPAYAVVVYGPTQPIEVAVRDDVYRIAREGVANAFQHAAATSIEVEVHYTSHSLRILVRDDGCGISEAVLAAGRDGHWGLPGMRERSEFIGSQLRLRSRVGVGTEVELVVPGKIAFGARRSAVWRAWLRAWSRRGEKLTAARGVEDDPGTVR
jgi:ligand-binding sensor domain-containing protein/signal transduction histidine kinase